MTAKTIKAKIQYYRRVVRWLWIHRAEPDTRQKWRRFAREVK